MANNFLEINLGQLSNHQGKLTTLQAIRALEATTTLKELRVHFDYYDPSPANNQRVIEPLCRCISNLRLHNAQHPLRQLGLRNVNVVGSGMQDGVLAQFLVATKQFGFVHVQLSLVEYLPIQVLVEFCRDSNSLKILELDCVSFSSGVAALPLPVNNGPPNNSVILTLDKLTLEGVRFRNSTAATIFANFVAHVNVSSLELGIFPARNYDDEEEEDDNDTQITKRILSELKMPSAEQLTLSADCRTEHFKAALDAGTTTVDELYVVIHCGKDDKTARLELLASFIRRAVKLSLLIITFLDSNGPRISLPPLLFRAMEACATVTYIKVIRYNHQRDIVLGVCPEVQQLQKTVSRNRELVQFATNPGTYPTDKLPELMLQFENCPTGRYILALRLPEVLSFAELCAMHLSTNPPAPKKPRLQ